MGELTVDTPQTDNAAKSLFADKENASAETRSSGVELAVSRIPGGSSRGVENLPDLDRWLPKIQNQELPDGPLLPERGFIQESTKSIFDQVVRGMRTFELPATRGQPTVIQTVPSREPPVTPTSGSPIFREVTNAMGTGLPEQLNGKPVMTATREAVSDTPSSRTGDNKSAPMPIQTAKDGKTPLASGETIGEKATPREFSELSNVPQQTGRTFTANGNSAAAEGHEPMPHQEPENRSAHPSPGEFLEKQVLQTVKTPHGEAPSKGATPEGNTSRPSFSGKPQSTEKTGEGFPQNGAAEGTNAQGATATKKAGEWVTIRDLIQKREVPLTVQDSPKAGADREPVPNPSALMASPTKSGEMKTDQKAPSEKTILTTDPKKSELGKDRSSGNEDSVKSAPHPLQDHERNLENAASSRRKRSSTGSGHSQGQPGEDLWLSLLAALTTGRFLDSKTGAIRRLTDGRDGKSLLSLVLEQTPLGLDVLDLFELIENKIGWSETSSPINEGFWRLARYQSLWEGNKIRAIFKPLLDTQKNKESACAALLVARVFLDRIRWLDALTPDATPLEKSRLTKNLRHIVSRCDSQWI